ncbi:MAG: TonB-dependent receptor [Pseudomonadota bacterium]
MLKSRLLGASSAFIMVAAPFAAAQEDEAAAEPVVLASADENERTLGTITVTGQKIARSLQDTQASVEVITDIEIERENILDLVDAIERTANITTLDGSNFTIRGVNSTSVSGAGQGNLATIYVDGVALPRTALFGAPTEIWDISQVEILRGPQSTLQGRASLAGAIIVNTADPTYDWNGRSRAIYTTEEERTSFAAAIGGPIIADQVAFRLAAETSESDGFTFNPVLNEPADPIETQSFRGKLLVEPNAIPGLEVVLSYSQQESSDGDSFNTLSVPDPEETRELPLNTSTRYETVIDIATAVIDYEINENWSVTSLTGWNEVDYEFIFDVNRDPLDPSIQTSDQLAETLQQELRLIYQGDALEAVFGFFISEEDTPNNRNDGQLLVDITDPVRLVLNDPAFPVPLDPLTQQFIISQYAQPTFLNSSGTLTQTIETWAIYADGSWEVDDKWTLYAGFRYDVENQSNGSETNISLATTLPMASGPTDPLGPIYAVINGIIADEVQASNTPPCVDGITQPPCGFEADEFGGFLPKLGVGYDFDRDRSVSFTIQRGYRSGGTGINAANATAFQFDQEFTWNYELALRSQWMDQALTLNANVFYVDWTDQQVRVLLDPINVFDTEIQNAGASNVYGFEIETNYIASDTLDFYGSIGYSKTEFDEFFVNRGDERLDFAGNEFPGAPNWTVNAGATWQPTENWIANVNANYSDEAYIRADDFQLRQDIDARTLVNFRAGWQNENFGIYLAGNNLLDEDYVISQFPNLTQRVDATAPSSINNAVLPDPLFAQYGDPRTFSIQLEARF